jgi:NAD(P)H dehydrogenase (quinone)
MIVITGGSGRLGSLMAQKLLERMEPSAIALSVREPEKAAAFASRGVRVRRGDYTDPDSLKSAFEGATQVLLVSSDAGATGGDPIAQHRNAIAVARAAGARRIVYTSHMAASASSAFPPMHTHAETENMLRESGIAWTALRNGFYANSILSFMGHGLTNGAIDVPADGKVAWTAHEDLAEAAAVVLQFDGPTPPLTGSESLDFTDLASIASQELGRTVERNLVDDDAFRAQLVAYGMPAAVVDILVGFYIAARNGEFATTDPTLAQLIGRPPIRARDIIASATHSA